MPAPYPWQQRLWQQFSTRSQYAHAYLFHGPLGIGKQALAEGLAALLLCLQPKEGYACGQCRSCLLLQAETHPDYFRLQPEKVDKAIQVDQVRELVAFVYQTPQLGHRKLVLIEPAEAMTVNATNALLKCLEEPSGDTLLLLISHHPSQLLPTLKSRCIQQACPLPAQEEAQNWLANRLPEIDTATCQQLLQLAGGSPLLAQRLYVEDGLALREQVVAGIKALLKQQQLPSQLAEQWVELPLLRIFDWCYDWCAQLLCFQLTNDPQQLVSQDMARVLGYLAKRCAASEVMDLQSWLLEQRQLLLNRANLNRQLLLESLLIRWMGLSNTASRAL